MIDQRRLRLLERKNGINKRGREDPPPADDETVDQAVLRQWSDRQGECLMRIKLNERGFVPCPLMCESRSMHEEAVKVALIHANQESQGDSVQWHELAELKARYVVMKATAGVNDGDPDKVIYSNTSASRKK